MVPTVHLNVRYFELAEVTTGERVDAWFGGGTDLTPTYPSPDDARHFHQQRRALSYASLERQGSARATGMSFRT